MTRTRLGALVLCAMSLGLMAVSASGAQAAQWLILNSSGVVKTGAELKALVRGELEPSSVGVLLTTILGIKTELLCSAVEFIGISVEGAGALTNSGKMKFTGCDVKLNGTLNKECELHSSGSPIGTIETLALRGQLALALTNGVGGIILEPQTGTTFVVVEAGAGCPIGNKITIEGKLVLEDCSSLTAEKQCVRKIKKTECGEVVEGEELPTHLITHGLIEDPIHSALTMLKNSAKIDGRTLVSLAGADVGLKWSGDKE